MKPTGVNLNNVLYFDLDTLVKMPDTECFDPNAEVKMIDNEVGMKPHGQNLVEWLHFKGVCFEKR